MRRVLAVGVSVLFGLTACAQSVPGADGDLTNGWPRMDEVAQFAPQAESCHAAPRETISYLQYEPVNCSDAHQVESVYVGEFGGAIAAAGRPPTPNSADTAAAFRDCDDKSTEYLGRQWRDLNLRLSVAVPSAAAWAAGARWFSCDLSEITGVGELLDTVEQRSGSLRSTDDSGLEVGCYNYRSNAALDAVACTQSHNLEYVGTIFAAAKMTWPTKTSQWDPLHDRCWAQAGKFIGIPNARAKVGVYLITGESQGWAAGDRGVRCFLWLNKGSMKTSAKDSGGKGLNYRD